MGYRKEFLNMIEVLLESGYTAEQISRTFNIPKRNMNQIVDVMMARWSERVLGN